MDVRGGTGSFSNNVLVANEGRLIGDGTFATHTVTVNAGGTLAPGHSIGTMNFTNDLSLAGTLEVQIDGLSGSADMINVAGKLDIGTAGEIRRRGHFDQQRLCIRQLRRLGGKFCRGRQSAGGLHD